MVGEKILDKTNPLYEKLMKLSKKENALKIAKKAAKKAAAEPSILELSTLAKVKPEVLEEQISSKKMETKKL